MKNTATIFLSLLAFLFYVNIAYAQVAVTEIMYDLPKDSGSDGGREWLEVLNTGNEDVDISSWRLYEAEVNHKLKSFQGDTFLQAGGYAIIADNPGKFLLDWPGFSGAIFDSSFSLKNTGESISIRDADLVDIDTVVYDSGQGAKGDGDSLQKTSGGWVAAIPTPGSSDLEANHPNPATSSNTENSAQGQVASSPPPPIVSSGSTWPVESQIFTRIITTSNVIVVGADILFRGEALGLIKKPLDGARYMWIFGDGSNSEGEKVLHYYNYPGEYVVILNASSGKYTASDRVIVKAIPANIEISSVGSGEDSFVEIYNKTKYELNLSWWRLRAGGQFFNIPEDTIILPGRKIIFSSQYTKFNITERENIELLYPNSTVAYTYLWESGATKAQTKVSQTRPVSSKVSPVSGAVDSVSQQSPQVVIGGGVTEESGRGQGIVDDLVKNQSANVFTAAGGEGNNIYKWFMALVGLIVISILSILYTGRAGAPAADSGKEADEYEITED